MKKITRAALIALCLGYTGAVFAQNLELPKQTSDANSAADYNQTLAAANQGDADAQERLGWMYIQGKDVTQDYAQAIGWFRKAADQGRARPQYNLCIMYEQGLGVKRSPAQALEWLRKSAEGGDAAAQYKLGRNYANGWGGLAKNRAEANAWFHKAADQGYELAQRELKRGRHHKS